MSCTSGYDASDIAVVSSRPSSAHSLSVWMSCKTCSNSKPRVSIAPAASAQNMNASSGSGLCPRRISMRAGSYLHWPRGGAAERIDPALPARDLQAELGRGQGDGHRARAAPARLRSVRERDGEEADGALARAARALPRRRAHAGGRTRRARGDPASPPAGAVPRRDARPRTSTTCTTRQTGSSTRFPRSSSSGSTRRSATRRTIRTETRFRARISSGRARSGARRLSPRQRVPVPGTSALPVLVLRVGDSRRVRLLGRRRRRDGRPLQRASRRSSLPRFARQPRG